MSVLDPILFLFQKVVLRVAYGYYLRREGRPSSLPISWVVGPNEIASMVHQLADAIPRSHSVSLSASSYYTYAYDSALRTSGSARVVALRRLVQGPLLLARLMTQATGFIYVGATGFLIERVDHRRFEFGFLKRHGKFIVCYWTGSDIRSTVRMNELEKETGLPNISTYIRSVNPVFGTPAHEARLRSLAAVADDFADAMFSNSVDHLSYLTRPTEPFLYLLPDEDFVRSSEKFADLSALVVAHGTTSPIIKGTQLVRAAVAKLRNEGYEFEYIELIGLSHDEVMVELRRTHIALNQFYGFSTTVFGVEALAARCALLMSADRTIEPDLQPGANEAWMVTRYFEVYDNLKHLLDNPSEIESRATRGYDWAFANASRTHAGEQLMRVLNAVVDGTYRERTA